MISIAMCTCNGSSYVEEQLQTILAQTRAPDELVVCDDASDDGTAEIVERLAAKAPFPLKLTVNERRVGSTRNFAQAISLCSGEIVVLSDQDDLWEPHKLATIEQAFCTSGAIGAVFSDGTLIDASGGSLNSTLWAYFGFPAGAQRRMLRGEGLSVLLQKQVVTGAALAFRRSYVPLILPIPEYGSHDRWIACLISAVALIIPLPERLIRYRRHGTQQIGASLTSLSTAVSTRRVGDWAQRQIQVALKPSATAYAELADFYAEARQRLAERAEFSCSPDMLAALDGKVAHLRARATLPAAWLRRAGAISKEFLSGSYFRYSNGLYSIAGDLIGR